MVCPAAIADSRPRITMARRFDIGDTPIHFTGGNKCVAMNSPH